MGKGKPAVMAWIGAVTLVAVGVTALLVDPAGWTLPNLLAVAVLAFCAAVTHVFPIKSATDGVSYKLTNVFVVAGAIILPPGLLALLVALAVAPELYQRRHRPRVLIGWIFNVSQTVLSAHAAGIWVRALGTGQLNGPVDLAVWLGAAGMFILAQALLVGVIICLDAGIPFMRVPTFSPPALFSDGMTGVLGIAVAGLWDAKPVLLVLVPLVLLVAHRMTRTAHLAHLAEVDAKTGLHNSRHFEQALEEELTHSTRVGRPLSLLFADLDHFKRVNDTYGHAAGDEVLRQLSSLLTASVRKGDIVARFGGEEFVVMLPGTDGEEAGFLGERIRAGVDAHGFSIDEGRTISCTVSVGIATCPADGTTVEGLIKQADTAMYRAKQTRNAVARAQMLPPVRWGSEAGASTSVSATVSAVAGAVASTTAGAPAAPPPPAPKSRLATPVMWGLIVAGLLVIAYSAVEAVRNPDFNWLMVLPFIGLGVAAEFLKVQVFEARRERLSLSFSNAVILAGVTAVPLGALVAALTASVMHMVIGRQRQLSKVLFNVTNLPLAASAAAVVYQSLRPGSGDFTVGHMVAALAATTVYYVVNVGAISLMISLHSGRPLVGVMRESFWFTPTNILLGLTGAFVGGAHDTLGVLGMVMFVVPALVMRFTLTFYARQSQHTIETLQAAKTEVEQAHTEKEEILRKLIETVALIIDARDNSVSGHSRRVAKFAVALGKELGMNPAELAVLHTAGLFHDLGKVGIPESILHKPARLTEEEYHVIQQHAGLGERLLSEVDQLSDIAQMVGEHHERYDGMGYPKRLKGEAISLGGRILVAADALETMLADRPYSKGRTLDDALAEMDRCAGTHFDPAVVVAVHRAVTNLGPMFFTDMERRPERDWGAADRILSEVFA